jgi:hypothetical protein
MKLIVAAIMSSIVALAALLPEAIAQPVTGSGRMMPSILGR